MNLKEVHELIYRTYRQKLNREPDPIGYKHHFDLIKNGIISPANLAKLFEELPEYKSLEDFRKGRVKTKEGFDLILDRNDFILSRALAIDKEWELEETNLFKKEVKKGMNVIDIGSHIGYFTVLFSKLVGEKGKVFAFEPFPRSFEILKQNLVLNNLNNVKLSNEGISNYSGKGELFLQTNEGSVDNRMYEEALVKILDYDRKSIIVRTKKLDEIEFEDKIDFIKMDVQGYESQIIEGAKKMLRESTNLKMLVEFIPNAHRVQGKNEEDFIRLLDELGFEIFAMENNDINKIDIEKLYSLEDFGDPGWHVSLFCIKSN